MVDTTGFVTSLVINGAIALIAIAIFIYYRPRYPWCFDTRRNPKRRIIGTEPPTVPDGLFGWLPKILQLTDAQVLSTAGLDALMFIKFFEFCVVFFMALCVVGLGILLPVNFTSESNLSDAFDMMSMGNIPTGNRRFWAHLIIGYIISGVFYFLAYHTWTSYMNYRHQHLARWTLLGGNHTVLLHELPKALRSDEALLAHFQALYPGQIRAARMAKDLRMKVEKKGGPKGNELESLQDNVAARDAVVKALEHDVLAWEKQQADKELPDDKRNVRPLTATKMMCCGKVDAIDHHFAELQRLNGLIASKQSEFHARDGLGPKENDASAGAPPTLLSGFVTFHSSRVAIAAAKAYVYDTTPHSFEARMAPELRDVYWPSLNMSYNQRTARTIIFNVITGLLCLFWMIPMGFLMGISNLTGLAEKYSWLSGVNSIPTVILGFIEAYLPAIMLMVFFIVLPMILLAFSQAQGIEAYSWLQKSVIHKYFLFMVINFFFGAIVGGAIFSDISALLSDVGGVPTVLGRQIPTVSTYFVTYVALAAFAGFPLQMAQLGRLIGGGVKKKWLALTTREFEDCEAPPALDYGVAYCPHLFIFLVAITYALIAPIIIPFATVYFALGFVVFKYQLVHVFVQKFESGGVFWPVVYSKMSSSLFIAQLCLVGILGLKEVPAQAVLVVPLPILTLLFDRYIHGAIKEKLVSLPLPQMVEIDALRKAERLLREKQAAAASGGKQQGAGADGAAPSFDAVEKKEDDGYLAKPSPALGGASGQEMLDRDIESAKLAAPHDLVTPRASDRSKMELQYEQRGETVTEANIPSLRVHTTPHAVSVEQQNGTTKGTRSYLADEERNDGSFKVHRTGPNLQQLGFPYADDEQDRAWVEGDVPAYVQPELADSVPADVEVERAQQLLSASFDRHKNDGAASSTAVARDGQNKVEVGPQAVRLHNASDDAV